MSSVDIYWLPLGAGGRVVHANGVAYEQVSAWWTRRTPRPLFHSALTVTVDTDVHVVEMTPAWQHTQPGRGIVARGPVGTRWAGRSRYFRYEVHCWKNGTIDDVDKAVSSPQHLSTDPGAAARVVALIHSVPVLVWGRDELGTGDMWNSNSVISWVLTRSGVDLTGVHPPNRGRAPGWHAGILAAQRSP
ncbi:hypothetical protein ABH922_001893 [Rhodococcus sp. 27YEA15]|uniref:hypothetical protein n=1 Tax=Rhodococcus sp. 27YEA15 TaxID=3156259 RepID=UPI003C7E86BE